MNQSKIERRNRRERNRVKALDKEYTKLKSVLPFDDVLKSRLQTVNMAISYIKILEEELKKPKITVEPQPVSSPLEEILKEINYIKMLEEELIKTEMEIEPQLIPSLLEETYKIMPQLPPQPIPSYDLEFLNN